MTDEQKQKIVAALQEFGKTVLTAGIALVIAILAILNVLPQAFTVQPSGGIGVLTTNQKIVTNRSGQQLEVQAGGSLLVDAGATEVHAGAANFTGVFSIAGTPISYGASQSTATPVIVGGVFTATSVIANSFTMAGTPVVPFATPRPTSTPNISGGLYQVCGSTTITGTGTIAHGLATPSYIMASLAQDPSADSDHVSVTNASATVTLKVWNNAAIPTAAASPAVIDWCAVGTK